MLASNAGLTDSPGGASSGDDRSGGSDGDDDEGVPSSHGHGARSAAMVLPAPSEPEPSGRFKQRGFYISHTRSARVCQVNDCNQGVAISVLL